MKNVFSQSMRRARVVLAVGLAVVIGAGCSFSDSSESISDSISSPFESSSNSSGGGDEGTAYRSDVVDYTVAYVKADDDAAGGSSAGFRNGLGRVATEHAVSNWEEDPSTYAGIGQGLARADVPEDRLDSVTRDLVGDHVGRIQIVESEYRAFAVR